MEQAASQEVHAYCPHPTVDQKRARMIFADGAVFKVRVNKVLIELDTTLLRRARAEITVRPTDQAGKAFAGCEETWSVLRSMEDIESKVSAISGCGADVVRNEQINGRAQNILLDVSGAVLVVAIEI